MNDKIDYKQVEDRIDSLVAELRSIQNAGKYPQKVCNPVMHGANMLEAQKKVISTVKAKVERREQENSELKGLNAAYRLAYDLEKLTDEELQIFKVENKETIEKLFKLLNK